MTPSSIARASLVAASLLLALAVAPVAAQAPETAARPASGQRPNVLFIAVDDLNDWIGCMGGHPQTRTPNLDRLAASGVLFTNAHCAAPACNPSRSAILTGRAPNRSGLYDNRQRMREVMPDEKLLPVHFREHGYEALGSGKLLHYFIDAGSWDEYFPDAASENPLPSTHYPERRPVSLPRGGPWQYVETDWAPLDVTDEQFGGDYSVSQWVGEQLRRPHDEPFFLGCGIYRPHEPWFVPRRWFEPFPLDEVRLPPGYREDDLDDVPAAGVRMARNRYFAHIQAHGQWRQGIQGYLASIHFADAMVGRVLDALAAGPHADDTIVVLWSDHGWQLGEKEHWQKYTGWRAVTRVPLIVCVPPGSSAALPAGTTPGAACDEPVDLLALFPTLLELCGLPPAAQADGHSLLPLLRDPSDAAGAWDRIATTFLAQPGSYALSGRTHRYIHYHDGSEELYDVASDPYEWTNLADDPAAEPLLRRFRARAPTGFAPRKAPSVGSLGELRWQPLAAGDAAPASKPDGDPFDVYFQNRSGSAVELCWMDPQGRPRPYGSIEPGGQRPQRTRPGAVWMVRTMDGEARGYFRVGDRSMRAVVPK